MECFRYLQLLLPEECLALRKIGKLFVGQQRQQLVRQPIRQKLVRSHLSVDEYINRELLHQRLYQFAKTVMADPAILDELYW